MRTSRRLALVLSALAALLVVPATAFAYAPTGDDFITCAAEGDNNVECVAGVFEENTDCTFETSSGQSGSGQSDGDGEFSFDFDVPEGTTGDIDVTVTCGSKVLSDTVANVNAEGEVIANAGADTGTIVAVALGTLLIGGGILAVSRRRTSTNA